MPLPATFPSHSAVIRDLLHACGNGGVTIPVPIDTATLIHVMRWCEIADVPLDFDSLNTESIARRFTPLDLASAPLRAFVKILSCEELRKVLHAANFLDAAGLYDLAAKALAYRIEEATTPRECRLVIGPPKTADTAALETTLGRDCLMHVGRFLHRELMMRLLEDDELGIVALLCGDDATSRLDLSIAQAPRTVALELLVANVTTCADFLYCVAALAHPYVKLQLYDNDRSDIISKLMTACLNRPELRKEGSVLLEKLLPPHEIVGSRELRGLLARASVGRLTDLIKAGARFKLRGVQLELTAWNHDPVGLAFVAEHIDLTEVTWEVARSVSPATLHSFCTAFKIGEDLSTLRTLLRTFRKESGEENACTMILAQLDPLSTLSRGQLDVLLHTSHHAGDAELFGAIMDHGRTFIAGNGFRYNHIFHVGSKPAILSRVLSDNSISWDGMAYTAIKSSICEGIRVLDEEKDGERKVFLRSNLALLWNKMEDMLQTGGGLSPALAYMAHRVYLF